MQHANTTADVLTTFAATTYGQWRRFSIEFPSPHREARPVPHDDGPAIGFP
jgi:hypothetical protein